MPNYLPDHRDPLARAQVYMQYGALCSGLHNLDAEALISEKTRLLEAIIYLNFVDFLEQTELY